MIFLFPEPIVSFWQMWTQHFFKKTQDWSSTCVFCRRCWYHARPFLSLCLSDVYIYLLVRFLPGQNDLEQSLLSVRTHRLPAHAHGRQQILVSLHFLYSGPKNFWALSSHLKICITQQNINHRVIHFNIKQAKLCFNAGH